MKSHLIARYTSLIFKPALSVLQKEILFTKKMSRKSSRRQSLVSLLIKSSENVSLRLLSDEVKKIHKQQIEAVNTQHQSEMELISDLVTFMRIKGKISF